MVKVRLQIPGFYGVLTQHFDNPDIVYLPSYTSNIFSTGQTVFVTRYPDVDKNAILPLKVQFHEYPVVSIHISKLPYLDADIDGDCVAVWFGDNNWEIDDIEEKPFEPLKSLNFSDIKKRIKKISESMLMDLLNLKLDFNQYIEDVQFRFHVIDKVPMLTGTLFKRFALQHYGLFFYDLKDNIRFVLNAEWKYEPSNAFFQTTKNYDIWIRAIQIICNRLNNICLKFKHPVNSIDDLRKVLSFLKACNIDTKWFENEFGVSHDPRYTSIEEFTFWFTKDIEKDAFEVFKTGIKTSNNG